VLQKYFPKVSLYGQRRELEMRIKLLGDLPERYWQAKIRTGLGKQNLFTLMDRINKAPNYALAWASGLTEDYRCAIRPLDEPVKLSPMLKSHYFAMIGICDKV